MKKDNTLNVRERGIVYHNKPLDGQLYSTVNQICTSQIFNDEVKKEIQELIDQGASMTSSTLYCTSPLILAVVNNLGDVVKFFIYNKVDINCPVFYMYKEKVGMAATALCKAAEKGLLDMVRLLLENNASMEMNSTSIKVLAHVPISPIHLATENNHVEVVKFLLEKGAKYNVAEGSFNKTAYQLAKEMGYKEILDLFERDNPQDAPECTGQIIDYHTPEF